MYYTYFKKVVTAKGQRLLVNTETIYENKHKYTMPFGFFQSTNTGYLQTHKKQKNAIFS